MSFRKAVAWSVMGQILSFVFSFGGSVVVAHYLEPRELGVFAIALATAAILNTLTSFGLHNYVVRAENLTPQTISAAFTLNAIVALLASAALVVVAVVQVTVFQTPDVPRVLFVLAVSPLIGIFEFRPTAMLQREMRFSVLSVVGTLKIIVSTVLVVSLAMLGFSYMSLGYGVVLAACFSALCFNLVARDHIGFSLSLAEFRDMMRFGLSMMSIGGVATLAARLSDIILGNMLGLPALGLYSRATNISNNIFDNLYGAMTRVVFVRLSKEYRETGAIHELYLRSFQAISALMWPLLLGIAILSGPFVALLYGERWLGAAAPLSLLMMAQFVVVCFGMNWELMVLHDESPRLSRIEAVRAVAGLVTFSAGCLFSIAGAAVGRIAEALFGLVLYRPHVDRLARTRPGEMARIYANGAMATAAAVLPSAALMAWYGWSAQTPMSLIIPTVFLGIALWFVVLVRQDHPLIAELDPIRRKLGLGTRVASAHPAGEASPK
jgi:O-antigen/teichoic acid export membrane protein